MAVMVPAKASNSNFEGWYLKSYLIRVQNTFSKSDLYLPNKDMGQVLILTLVPLSEASYITFYTQPNRKAG